MHAETKPKEGDCSIKFASFGHLWLRGATLAPAAHELRISSSVAGLGPGAWAAQIICTSCSSEHASMRLV